MTNKKKALIAGIIVAVLLGAIILYLSYLGLSPDSDRVDEVEKQANQYMEEHFQQDYEIIDTLYDNVDVYDTFSYAAIVELENDDRFKFLVFEHNETNELTDSYVAEHFEYELESVLQPLLNEAYGEDNVQELWLTYPKDAGQQLNLDHTNVTSVTEHDLKPVIRITLDRGQEDDDEEKLDQIISEIQDELNISGGHVTLSFNDSAIMFKDKDIKKEF
ncbi:hypothetical protein [Piscibacillus halophilus]|uniref:hypothetical protein n=1 Tax=Piscibacillus halophilus TaxID=571933 RepID=UPI00158DF420|nr:hypothetical protein [Piscibacillus halophilus]